MGWEFVESHQRAHGCNFKLAMRCCVLSSPKMGESKPLQQMLWRLGSTSILPTSKIENKLGTCPQGKSSIRPVALPLQICILEQSTKQLSSETALQTSSGRKVVRSPGGHSTQFTRFNTPIMHQHSNCCLVQGPKFQSSKRCIHLACRHWAGFEMTAANSVRQSS